MDGNSISVLAETNWRNNRKRFGLRQEDRRHHMYVIGKTGTGKSTLLATLLRQDLDTDVASRSSIRMAISSNTRANGFPKGVATILFTSTSRTSRSRSGSIRWNARRP